MTKRGYRGVSLKGEVVEKLQAKAKESGKTLSAFLEEVLQSYGTGEKEVLEKGSTITKVERYENMIKEIEEMQNDIKAVREVLEELRR